MTAIDECLYVVDNELQDSMQNWLIYERKCA